MDTNRIFLLSPARCNGPRAQMLLNEGATFETAVALRTSGVRLGRVFTFLSGLYFRGKMAYARAFARPASKSEGIWVITPSRGLVTADTPITLDCLRGFAEVDIAADDPRYRVPLQRDARMLAASIPKNCEVVLLGSIATDKYVDVLEREFESRLLFPSEFVGRGDMSRGGLMLRSAADRQELNYIPVSGAVRRGSRPAKLPRRRYDQESFEEDSPGQPHVSSGPASADAKTHDGGEPNAGAKNSRRRK